MDEREIEVMVNELENITKQLDDAQKEIHRSIAEKLSSIQRMIESLPDQEGQIHSPARNREIILEKARVILRENGESLFEGLC